MALKQRIKKIIKSIFQEEKPNWLILCAERGMRVGADCEIQDSVYFDYHHCQHIFIGNRVTMAPEVFILAHDASTKKLCNYTRIAKVVIEDNVFLGARVLVMPGVTIGEDSIIGAGSVVTNDIPKNSLAVGNPARVIKSIEEYREKVSSDFKSSPQFDEIYTFRQDIPAEERDKLNNEMNSKMDNHGYII